MTRTAIQSGRDRLSAALVLRLLLFLCNHIPSAISLSCPSVKISICVPRRGSALSVSSAESLHLLDKNDNDDMGDTIVEVRTPRQQRVTLIGTAHMSKLSQDQVKEVIARVQPNVVLVELDPTRLHRIGIDCMEDIAVDRVVTAAEDVLPINEESDGFNIFRWWQRTFLDGFSEFARKWLTSMYDGMRDRQKHVNKNGNGDGDTVIPGGEFLVAIRAAEQCSSCDTVVLGDRSSVTTIQRAAQLAWDSGDALGVLKRLGDENAKAMEELRQRVRSEIGLNDVDEKTDTKEDEARLEVAVMEALKKDSKVRDRLFERLEETVPEFTQAFLKERDIIMSESIRRELDRPGVEKLVAVVGLAHVTGIRDNLQASLADSVQ